MTFCEIYPLVQGATLTAKGAMATALLIVTLLVGGAYMIERAERKRKKQLELLSTRYHLRLPPGENKE